MTMQQQSEIKTEKRPLTKAAAKIIKHEEKFYLEIYIATPFSQTVIITSLAEAEQIAQEINEKLFEISQDK